MEEEVLAQLIEEVASKSSKIKEEEVEKKVLEKIKPKFDEINKRIEDSLKTIFENLKNVERRIGKIKTKSLEEELSILKQTFSKKIEEIDEKLKHVEKITSLETQLNEIREALKERKKTRGIFGELPELTPEEEAMKVLQLEKNLKNLEKLVKEEISNRISALETSIKMISEIPVLKKEILDLKNKVGKETLDRISDLFSIAERELPKNIKKEVETRLEPFKDDIRKIKKSISEITDRLHNTIRDVKKVKFCEKELENFEKKLTEIKKLEKEIKSVRDNLKASLESVKKEYADVIGDIKSDLVRIGKGISELVSSQEILSKEVERLNEKFAGLKSDLSSLKFKQEGYKDSLERINKWIESFDKEKIFSYIRSLNFLVSKLKNSIVELERKTNNLERLVQSIEEKLSKQEKIIDSQLKGLKELVEGLK